MIKNILITGGSGFIGSNLAIKLIDKGYKLTVFDNLSTQVHGKNPEKTSPLYKSIKGKVNFIKGSVTSIEYWEKAITGQDAIIHMAAETGTGQSMYEITNNINSWLINEQINSGQLNIFIKHTSASLCIQENASEDVMDDILDYFTKLVPENPSLYKHNIEGKDDMPAHIKSLLTQTSLIIPVENNQMDLGTWQGVFLFEHRIASMQRRLKLTLFGN